MKRENDMHKFTGVCIVLGLLATVLATLSGPSLYGFLFVVLSFLCGLVAVINELATEHKGFGS